MNDPHLAACRESWYPASKGAREAAAYGSIIWGPEVAEVYDETYAAMLEPSVLDPIADVLAGLARGGPALEFAVGTGRVALALSAPGSAVHGLELSRHMAERLFAKPGADAVPVTIGDMTATRVPGTPFKLVYLVANTIMNVTTQDDQVAVFANAAAHLEPGGCFVVEVIVPQLRRVPPGRPPGSSPSNLITSGSRHSTTWWGKSRGRITGSKRKDAPHGRAKLRERVKVEHTLAHVGRWQGRRARYLGQRKNLFDLRRIAVVHNLHVIARQSPPAKQAS